MEFSPDDTLFALLDSDGKLKIWDVKESRLAREYVPKLHLSAPQTCFVWFESCAKKGRNNKHNPDSTLYIALGTSNGGVNLYSYAADKLEFTLNGNGHAGAVTSICLHKDTNLYTSGEDCQIVEWSFTDGCSTRRWSVGTTVPSCIVSLPISNSLLVGCKELSLWSLENYKMESTFTGHTTDVNAMKVLSFTEQNDEYVVTTAKSNREIYLWKIGAKKNPKGTFLMEYAATYVSCSIVGNGFMIAAVTGADITASGVVHLFIVDDISDIDKKLMNPIVTIQVAYDSGVTAVLPIPILTAKPNSINSQKLLLGYGSSTALRFEDVEYTRKRKQTLSREDPRIQINRQEKTREQAKTIVPIANNETNTQYGTGSVGSRKTKLDKKTNTLLTNSLDDRLKTLSVADDDAKGTSLAELLKQALHNRDARLLREVFFNKDENVIRSTLKRLPTQHIPSLLDELTQLTQKKTANVQTAVRWLRLLLQIHASQLMALGKDDLNDKFGSLLGIIEHRTHAFVPLTKLSGRLDFLLNQIKLNTDDDPKFNHENLLVIEDGETDESDSCKNEVNGDNEDANSTDEDIDMRNGVDDDDEDEDDESDDMDES